MLGAARLHRPEERRATGLTLLEGPHLLEEAYSTGVVVREVFSLDGSEGILVSQAALERMSSTRTPQSPVAVIEIPPRPLTPGRSVLAAWEISDPGNLGTMIRTAAAFGLDVMTTAGSADLWSPRVLRSAAGAHFHTGLSPLDLKGFTSVATTMTGGADPSALPDGPLAIVIGSEAHGLPASVLASADHLVSIPMPGGTESLNAAAAAAIICYEVSKRSGVGGLKSPGARSS
ncbi:MAG: TrmH family RNA methyltransferase [Acidimicrobiia bacterium]|nr:RNA methyltransferase [Acidimicrobiia bacterium]MDQ3501635.1 RNA methyltransferase [Actinomycetota bacterium]